MRFRAILLSLVAIFGVSFCGKKGDQAVKNQNEAIRAAITFTSGSVSIERNNEKLSAKIGTFLEQSDVVLTGAKSSAEIVMKGYGAIKLGADARLNVMGLVKGASEANVELKLERGDMASFITKRSSGSHFTVITPTAIAGVRGTDFLTSVEGVPSGTKKSPRVKVAVFDGAVAVNLPGQKEVILTKDMQLVIDGFQRISKEMIRTLSPESLQQIKELSLIHKSNIMEFNTLLDELRSSSPALRSGEGGSVSQEMDVKARKIGQEQISGDAVAKAQATAEDKHIKRDESSDLIKLKPTSGYKE